MTRFKPAFAIICLLFGAGFLAQGGYIHAKAWLAQILLEQAWQRTLEDGHPSRPWPWADTWPVSRLQAPEYGIDLIVLAGDSGRSLAFGPGHHFASALPGDTGNSIISAHRDTHFAFLRLLQPGDTLLVESPGRQHQLFTVDHAQVVNRDHAYFLEQHSQARLHLVTCYPFDALQPGGELRYIVSASAARAF